MSPDEDDPPTFAAARALPGEWQVDAPEEPVEEQDQGPEPAAPPRRQSDVRTPRSDLPPPPVERIVEALLFVGGSPLTAEHARAAVRGLSTEQFRDAVDELNRRYRAQGRPYAVRPVGDGFALAVKPTF